MTINKLLLAAAVAAPAVAFAAPATAQRLAAPVVAVVDAEKVMADCNACKTASTQLQAQLNQVRQYAQQVGAPLQTEGQSLDTAIKAANGKPDAALTTRIEAWQGKQQQAQQAIQQAQQTKQGPIMADIAKALEAYSKERNLGVVLDLAKLGDAVLFAQPELDVTQDFIAYFNAKNP